MSEICTWPHCAHTAKDQCKGTGLRSDADTITALRAEVERLRSAIERIYQSSAQKHIIEIARDALNT